MSSLILSPFPLRYDDVDVDDNVSVCKTQERLREGYAAFFSSGEEGMPRLAHFLNLPASEESAEFSIHLFGVP